MQKFGYNSDFLERLKYNNDLVSVISKYVHLQEKGNTYWGCCPFHHEKTPSFAVNSFEQYYHCFGCGKSGDVISFIKEMESVDFMEAVKILAENANMELPQNLFDENLIQKKKEKETILNALKLANSHYINNLKNSNIPNSYIKKRGLSQEIVNKFELGYSKDFKSLVDFLKNNKISYEIGKNAGLLNEKNGKFYDTMFNRLTFPIKNSFNEVIGFSSRILEENKEVAKYKNSPQTIVFDKSKVVFGVQFLKELKNQGKLNEIIIVEGQMDVISMHNAGFTNAVATMGTALTPQHAKELKRFSNKIVLCFDGDSAGQKATLKAIETLKKDGEFDIYCVNLQDNLDPDEYIKKFGIQKMQDEIKNAKDCFEYRIRNLSNVYNLNDKLELNKFIKECLNIVLEIKSNSEREVYLKLIREISSVSTEVLKRDLLNLEMPNKIIKSKEKFIPAVLTDNVYKSQLFILSSLLHKKSYAKFIEINSFNEFAFQSIYEYLKLCHENNKEPIIGALFDEIDSNDKELNKIINYKFEGDEIDAKYFNDCVKILKLDNLTKQQTLYTNQMMQAKTLEERKEFAIKLQKITKEINLLKLEDKID
ncbi:MAG: DNA primase [Clostridiales bacterium]|nr:DNA primase [Clostridiales bacterium]